ncbi:MAG TPA: hypothetical protein ENM97_01090 [Moorella mulderi]|nr:hypothetical protein [Moorella mulderi]
MPEREGRPERGRRGIVGPGVVTPATGYELGPEIARPGIESPAEERVGGDTGRGREKRPGGAG